MRAHEFVSEDQMLDEVSMSPTSLKQMASKINAQAGMEFEMIIPGAADGSEDYEMDSEPDYEMDEGFPTGRGWSREVIEFFRGGDYGSSRSDIQRAINSLDEDYLEWKGNEFDAWLNDNDSLLDDFLREELPQDQDESDDEYIERLGSNDRESEQARERAMDRMNEEFYNEDQFDEFLSDNDIRTMSDFGNQYNLDWPYYTYPDAPESGNISIDNVATDFSDAIGRPVNASSSYHGGTREAGKYVVEPDSSLQPDDADDGGLEFVSPPLPLDEMLSDLDKVAKWASRIGAYTNDSTGLHMNVSVPDFDQDRLDYVKLAIFLGDEYVLNQFGRAGNTYCKSAMAQIQQTAKTNPDKVQTMLRQMQGNLSAMASKIVHTGQTSKYTSINTKTGYIEFRSPGGDWLGEYAADADKLKNTLLRFVVSLDIAMKPELYRQEYMKKLYKTLAQGESDDTIQLFSQYAAGGFSQRDLKMFVKQAQMKRKAGKQEKDQIDSLHQELTGVSQGQLPPVDFNGNYEVYAVRSGNSVYRFRVSNTQEAYDMLQRWRASMMQPGLDPREFNVRAAAPQQPAQGTGSLPPGNTRWLILDQNGREVYSFVYRSDQGQANQYATNWLRQNRQGGEGEFTVVPVT